MAGYIIRRLLSAVPVLLGISILVFSFVNLIPGDPAMAMLGERVTAESVARVRESLGLDRPIWEQYGIYMGKVLRGDWGTTILQRDNISQELLKRFPATVELALAGILLAMLFGIPAGVFSAVKRKSWFDNGTMLVSLVGVSMPIFWLGLMMQSLFSVMLGWLPTGTHRVRSLGTLTITHFVGLDSLLQGN